MKARRGTKKNPFEVGETVCVGRAGLFKGEVVEVQLRGNLMHYLVKCTTRHDSWVRWYSSRLLGAVKSEEVGCS